MVWLAASMILPLASAGDLTIDNPGLL